MKHPHNRRLAAIMFADIQGYTAMMQQDEGQAMAVREQHRRITESMHNKFHGEIIQYYGDGVLSIFGSAVHAARCGIAIQKEMLAGKPQVPLRVGIHVGDILRKDNEVIGDSVNVAARIQSMSISGSVLISGKVNEELKNHPELTSRTMGFYQFKNVAEPLQVFTLVDDGINVPMSDDIEGDRFQKNKSLAVLPFLNLSHSDEHEYFSDGMTEEIINALSKIKGLKITSRTSSFFYKNKNVPLAEIGQALQVSSVLEGSVRLAGNQVRISAKLVDVADDMQFWSETFDRSMDNIFEVQDEISLLIAERLREHLGHFEIQDQLVARPDIGIDSYQDYLKSRYHLLKMGHQDIEKGFELLQSIIEREPNYTLAHLGMNLGYLLSGMLGYMASEEAFEKAGKYLKRAIELEPDHPQCRLQLSYKSFLEDWDLESAYTHVKNSLEQQQTVDGYQSMASMLVAEGKYKAASHYINTAIEIDPFSAINQHLKGFINYCNEDFGTAIKHYLEGLRLNPDGKVSLLYLGQAYLLKGQIEDARNHFSNLSETADELLKIGGMALVDAVSGHQPKAHEAMLHLEEYRMSEYADRASLLLILCKTAMQDINGALDLIESAIETRLPMCIYLPVDPFLRPLHGHKRFSQLMDHILKVPEDTAFSDRRYKNPLLSNSLLRNGMSSLKKLMEEEKVYLDPELTLKGLAEISGMPSNQMSQLLNEGFGQNFSEFVNSYRLDAFKVKVQDTMNHHKTILALAFESGFNSKTVFNTFFKKMTGSTPSKYWKSIVRQ